MEQSLLIQLKTILEDLSALGALPNKPITLVSIEPSSIQDLFQSYITKLGFDNIQVEVIAFDNQTGDLLLRFTNTESNEQVDVFITYIDDEEEVVSAVVSSDDEPVEVLLTNLNPPLTQYLIQYGIDYSKPLNWLTKSVIHAWLEAGKLLESYHVIRGNRKERLPLAKKGSLSPRVIHNYKRLQLRFNLSDGG